MSDILKNSHSFCSSVYRIFVKYKDECGRGTVVQDNRESLIDEEFLEFQTEKSTEGLSESFVQFLVQAVFLLLLVFLSLFSVGAHSKNLV